MLLYKLRKLILDGIIYLVNRVNIVKVVNIIGVICWFISVYEISKKNNKLT